MRLVVVVVYVSLCSLLVVFSTAYKIIKMFQCQTVSSSGLNSCESLIKLGAKTTRFVLLCIHLDLAVGTTTATATV